MDRYVKQISLLFENCEYADIPSSDINNIVIDGINRRIQRTAVNAINDMALADNCYICNGSIPDYIWNRGGPERKNEGIRLYACVCRNSMRIHTDHAYEW